jgi:hypothetical protein
MTDDLQQLKKHMKTYLRELLKVKKTEGLVKVCKEFKRLDWERLSTYLQSLLEPVKEKIQAKNTTLFAEPFHLLPGVELSYFWNKMDAGQQKRTWVYLGMFSLLTEPKAVEELKEGIDFIKGIGNVEEAGLGAEDLFKGTEGDMKAEGKPGSMEFMKAAGIDKMLGIDKLSSHLKDINPAELKKAASDVQKVAGSQGTKSGDIVGAMVSEIVEQLQSTDFTKGNVMENIFGIAEKTHEKLGPMMSSGDVSIGQLLADTQKLASHCLAKAPSESPASKEEVAPLAMDPAFQEAYAAMLKQQGMEGVVPDPSILAGLDLSKFQAPPEPPKED